jgi:EAL domain-containing protein (putative c-di-GMP-specific phosphodiesterase class I)
MTVAVNVSIPTLLADDFPQEVRELLAAYELPPAALEIEITEDVLMADGPSARAMIASLRETGITVSIDDYGTGYSSLNYLRDLSVDWLKLDRSLVTGIGEHIGAARIVESTIQLAHALGLRVIAEGVETGHDRHALQTFGCDAIQGYLLTPPIDASAFSSWLDAWERGGFEEELAA